MSWLRLDDGFSEHPKILELTDREFRAWLRVLLYCCRYNTRGKVPVRALAALPGLTRPMLARYRELGLVDVVDGVDVVHDFELYNGETIAVRVAKYLAEHPEATANDVVKAVGGTRNIVLSEVTRQRGNGLVPSAELVRDRFGSGTDPEPPAGTEIGTESVLTRAPRPVPLSTSNSSTSTQDPAAVLKQLGWKPWQIEQGLRDPLRALAWANASGNARNPGGWAWAGYIAGGNPTTDHQEEKPKMNVVDACQAFIESEYAWDETYDANAMTEEFGRIERKPRTEGTLTDGELAGLLEQWAATRQDRHGIPANLGNT